MKRLSLIIPIFAILFAVTGAFAMTNYQNSFQDEVYYWQNGTPGDPETECIQTEEVTPCEGSNQQCEKLIPSLSSTRDLFRDSECESPYLMP